MGDIVKVFVRKDLFAYLEVMEASAVLVKLGFVRGGEFQTDPVVFEQVIVGSSVIKISSNMKKVVVEPISRKKATAWDCDLLEDKLRNRMDEISELRRNLKNEQSRNLVLVKELSNLSLDKHIIHDERNRRLKEINALNGIVRKLRNKLENMREITRRALLTDNDTKEK